MDGIPHFDSAFLKSLAAAFHARRRLLSERACRIDLVRTNRREDGTEHERLEIEISGVVGKGPVFRVHAKADRFLWMDAWCPTQLGTMWRWTLEGYMAESCGPRHFTQAVETTYDLLGEVTPGRTDTLNEVWAPIFNLDHA